MILKWSRDNTKVSKLDAVSFGIPAYRSEDGFKTCPQAGACAAVCYARQGTYTFSVVKQAREYNLAYFRLKGFINFVNSAIEDLNRIRAKYVRVHDSGDFFNQRYLDAWGAIAWAMPEKTFYAYTKSIHLDFSRMPKNFKITQSMGGKLDDSIDESLSHSRIFSSHKAMKAAGYVDGNVNDLPAIKGVNKIGLVYHGVKNLTPAQEEYFK